MIAGGPVTPGMSGTVSPGRADDEHGVPSQWSGRDGIARPTLALVGCAAPQVLTLPVMVQAAQDAGWRTTVVLTPTAARWLESDLPTLARITGSPVRSEYSLPADPAPDGRPDAVLVAPTTVNSLHKCAVGISDTLALGVMNEAIGLGRPLVLALACQARDVVHPAFAASVAILRGAGVEVLMPELPDDVVLQRIPPTPAPAATGDPPTGDPPTGAQPAAPWRQALTLVTSLIPMPPTDPG